MRTSKDIKKEASVFSENEKRTIENLNQDMKEILTISKVNEDCLRKLDNVISSLQTIKDNFMWRVIRSAKQNHMLD